jgi:hypothetical protein
MASAPRPDSESGDAIATSLRELADRIEQLQGEVRRLGPVLPEADGELDWDEREERVNAAVSYAWLSSLDPAVRRRPAVPRLLLELLFLAAVAVAAALAELDAPAIAGVMGVAWVLVALIEWASSRADRRRNEVLLRPPPQPPQPLPADPSWFVPPVEQTLLDAGGVTGSVTASTKLPPAPGGDVETTAEHRHG